MKIKMKNDTIIIKEKLVNTVLLLISIILAVIIVKYLKVWSFCLRIFKIFIPVFIGFFYAWMINPLIRKLSQKYKRTFICIGLFLGIILIIGLFFYFLVPVLYKEVAELVDILPHIFNNFHHKIDSLGLKNFLDNLLVFLVDKVPLLLIDFIKSLFKYVGIIGVGLILGLYLSMDFEKTIQFIYKMMPHKYKCFMINLTHEVSNEVRKCINGTFLVAFAVFVLDSLYFWIIGIDAPLLFGALCGLTDLIPYIGPYIGGIAAVVVGFTESKLLGILCIIGCVVVQLIENYILQPVVMSKSIKISPVLIIIGLLVFGNLWGIVGMIIATPCVAILKVICEHIEETIKKCQS